MHRTRASGRFRAAAWSPGSRPRPRSSARCARRPACGSEHAPPWAPSGFPPETSSTRSRISSVPSRSPQTNPSPVTTRRPCCSPMAPRWRHCRAPPPWWRPSEAGAYCPADGLAATTRSRRPSARSRLWAARLLPTTGLAVGTLGHHDLAAEDADDRPVLLVADGLHVHDPAVVLRLGLGLVEDRRLAVDGVSVERRSHVPQRFDLQVGDGLPRDIREPYSQEAGINLISGPHLLSQIRSLLRVV